MSLLDSVLLSPKRSIGTIIPNVTIEEQHRDDVTITDHPVERGATISDHAFMRPAVIEMRCAWSDTAGGEGSVQQVYQELLALEEEREPFDVVTGKRMYSNMLISSLAVTTDAHSETALMVTAQIREVIIVSTQSTGSTGMGDQSQQASPSSTAQTVNAGSVQMVEASSSVSNGAAFGGNGILGAAGTSAGVNTSLQGSIQLSPFG